MPDLPEAAAGDAKSLRVAWQQWKPAAFRASRFPSDERMVVGILFLFFLPAAMTATGAWPDIGLSQGEIPEPRSRSSLLPACECCVPARVFLLLQLTAVVPRWQPQQGRRRMLAAHLPGALVAGLSPQGNAG